jgi:signal transduction histidine kinase
MKREMNELHDIKQNLLSLIAHEIKTPITGILSISEILKQESASTETRELAEELYISTNRIYQTFQNIFEYYEIDEESIETKEKKVHLNTILQGLQVKFSVKALQKGIGFELILPENEVFIKTYLSVLRKSLIILINNALKFTSSGKITLKLSIVQEEIHISVADTGVGIESDELEKIFEPFYQESKGLNRKYEGLGLSLNLCKKYCRLLGAKLIVNSEKNKGSNFIISLKQKI